MTESRFDNRKPSPAEMALQNRAINVIKPLIPHDAEERVLRSFKQWNQIVREHIRNETGLRLGDGEGRNSVPVQIVEGFPLPLAQLIGDYGDAVLWRLIVGQPKLGGLIEGLDFLLKDWPSFERWNKLPEVAKGGEPHLQRTLAITQALQQIAVADGVRKQIQQINRDILGLYCFMPGCPATVSLYWMPIAMIAAMLNVRIEDLTVVVLAHELAHGYTHIGRDIDGIQWSDDGFATTDLDIVEGLAQYYAEVVAHRLASRTPGPLEAYNQLLSLQSGPYRAHLDWVKEDPKQKGERIRFAMIATRSQGKSALASWNERLETTRQNLKTTNQSRVKDAKSGGELFDPES